MAHDIFISFSSKDKAIADAIVTKMESSALRCWVAPRDITPGHDWGGSIVEAIEESRIFILVFSESSNNSDQVKREVERAVSKGVVILPFRISDVSPSKNMEYYISTTHWLDALTRPIEKHIDTLVDHAKKIVNVEVISPHTDAVEPKHVEQILNNSYKKPQPLFKYLIFIILVIFLFLANSVFEGRFFVSEKELVSISEDPIYGGHKAVKKGCEDSLSYNSAREEASILNGGATQKQKQPVVICKIYLDEQPKLDTAIRLYARSLAAAAQYEKAIAFYIRAAELGDIHANLVLGYYYLHGRKNDRKLSITYLQKAADLNSLEAIIELGKTYELGRLSMPDYSKAVQFYSIASEKESAEGYYKLAQMYHFGLGVIVDKTKAQYLYRKALAFDHKQAEEALSEFSIERPSWSGNEVR